MTEKSAADRVLELDEKLWASKPRSDERYTLSRRFEFACVDLAPTLARQVKELEARCEQYEEDCDEIMAERDGHSDALLECSWLLGGPEWVARIPPQPPPESGDLDRDVPVLIAEMVAKVKELEANRCEHCGAKVSSYPNGCPGCGAPQCCQPCCDLQNARDRVKELEAERRNLSHMLERDRTAVAECVTSMKKAIARREWLRLGRGSYEWDDDRWKDEFGQAVDEIMAEIEKLAWRRRSLVNHAEL